MLSYFTKNGILYAKTQGKSVRVGKSVRKVGQKHIGRVIDKENNVFYSRERGMFTYDETTDTYGTAGEKYSSELKRDRRKKEKLLLDFGDVFFLDQLLKKMGYDKVLESIGYGNSDTLKAMVMYYVISEKANVHAQTWMDGNIARILYPNANVKSQRISEFLASLGDERKQQNYFRAHINWLKKNVCDDPAIIIDSTGLPNDIDTYLKNWSNHNGKISRETRMTTAVQRDSGYPFLYRLHPGNIVDTSTLTRTILTLDMYDVKADIALLDAGYCTSSTIDALYDNGIDFVTRLPERNSTLYREVIDKCMPELTKKENMYSYNGRMMYIKMTEVKIGTKAHTAYAYLGLDVDRHTDEIHKASRKSGSKKKSIDEMHDIFTNAGLFILISSLPYPSDGILTTYYTRQLVEQYFDISKGISRLTPLRGHTEETIYGHLMLCQIASTINLYIQKQMNEMHDNREELLMSLRNQKCTVYDTRIITSEQQSKANEFYRSFDIQCPASFRRKDSELIPEYDMKTDSQDE